jgi:dTDP-glucose 4,6-dehydratase
MNVLVTGAGGFIGSHLVEALHAKDGRVTAFLRYTSSNSIGCLKDITLLSDLFTDFVFGDIRSRDDVYRVVKDNKISHIIHLAAQIAIPWSYLSPEEFVNTNVIGTLNILMAAKEFGVRRVVHMSTSEVYGTAQEDIMDEFHPQVAQSPYAASKIAADKLCESFHRSFGLPVVIARPFNTYGPRQSGRAVIPSIILQALEKNEIQLGSLTCRRDFNYVEDQADALVKLCFSDKGAGKAFNLCSGVDHSLGGIVERVGKILGKNLVIKIDEQRVRPKDSEVDRLCGDGSLFIETFGIHADLDIMEGLKRTIDYFKEHKRPERFTL